MKAKQASAVPSWENFSAFGDTGELGHVCELFETATDEEWSDVSGLAGGNSTLTKRLVMQDTASRDLLESERPGLYPKTWMAHLMQQLYLTLDQITEKPHRLPGELSGLLLNFHKVLIAAHEIYDPRSRAKLIAEAACEAASGAIVKKNTEIAALDRASEGITLAIHHELQGRWNGTKPTSPSVWKRMKKHTESNPLKVGEFEVFMASGKLTSIYFATGKADGKPIGEKSFPRAFSRAKKSFAVAG